MESVGQRVSKIQAVEVRGLKKMSAVSAFTAQMRASAFGPDLPSSGVKPFSNFDGQ